MSDEGKGGETFIDESVQTFLREHIRSFEQLEVLLLLYRQRERTWTVEDAAVALRVHDIATQEAFGQLAGSGLLSAEATLADHFRYHPQTPELGMAVDRLVRACDERRIEIMKIMSAQSIERVRTNVMKVFADAFLLGRSGKPKRPSPDKPEKPGDPEK